MIRQFVLFGIPIAKPTLERKNLTLTPRIWRVYENTRDADCKGIKECKTLRFVRAGAHAGLAKRGKTPNPNRVICQKARLATSLLQPRILRNL